MYEREILGPVRFPSGVALISDPCFIYSDMTAEKDMREKICGNGVALHDVEVQANAPAELAAKAAIRLNATDGQAHLIIGLNGLPISLVIRFVDDQRFARAISNLKGMLSFESSQVMIADLTAVIDNYQPDHRRVPDGQELPFGYDRVSRDTAGVNGAAIDDVAVVANIHGNDIDGISPTTLFPLLTLEEGGEVIGLMVNFYAYESGGDLATVA